MNTKAKVLIGLMAAAAAAPAETRVSIGIHLGDGYGYYAPPPPPVYVYRPLCPGPGYVWVPGYWYGVGPRYAWRQGYWAPPSHHGFYGSNAYGSYYPRHGKKIKYRGDDRGRGRVSVRVGYRSGRR